MLQCYVDMHDDIQSVGLIAGRILAEGQSPAGAPGGPGGLQSVLMSGGGASSPTAYISASSSAASLFSMSGKSAISATSAKSGSSSGGGGGGGSKQLLPEMVWLSEYRGLLNGWQLFVERARLDVEIGE